MASPPEQPEKSILSLKIAQDVVPVYVNLARITHSPSEIVLDFALMVPGGPHAEIGTRVLMSP